MDLLKELPKNFRYYLLTSKQNNIYILYNKFAYTIGDNEETTMETSNMISARLLKDEYIDSQTIRKTVNFNDVNINTFYKDIIAYINTRKEANVKNIKFVNYNLEDNEIVFPTEIYKEVTECLGSNGNLIVDIRHSALRVHNEEYPQINNLKWISGDLLVEDSSPTLYFKTIYLEQCTIDVHDKDADGRFINIVAVEKANVINIKAVAALRVNILGNAETEDSYANSKLLISSYTIFGNECLQKDTEKPRLAVSRFKSCVIDNLVVEDEVEYGSIVKCDKLYNFTINRIERYIGDIAGGTPIIIGSVGNVMLNNIDLDITSKASLPDKSPLIVFEPDDSGMTRKINIYDTHIYNHTEINSYYLFKLSNVRINKIYLSDCIFDKGVNILDMSGESSVDKFSVNNTTISSDNSIDFTNIIKLSLFNNTLESDNIINLNAQRLNLENNNFKFKSMIIQNEEEPITKFSSTENVLSGTDFVMRNPVAEYCKNFYDTKSVIEVENFISEGYNCSFDETFFKCSNMIIGGDNTIKLLSPIIGCPDTRYECNCTFKSTVNGTVLIDDEDYIDKCNFNINVEDEIKYLTAENINFNITNKSPTIKFTTNMPINGKFINFDENAKIHMSVYDEYESKQKMSLICMNSIPDTHYDYPIVLNDSEQELELYSEDNEFDNKTFIFEPK